MLSQFTFAAITRMVVPVSAAAAAPVPMMRIFFLRNRSLLSGKTDHPVATWPDMSWVREPDGPPTETALAGILSASLMNKTARLVVEPGLE